MTHMAPKQQPQTDPLLVTVQEAAKLLKISDRTMYRMVELGHAPGPVHLGAAVRWKLDELKAWITAGCPSMKEWDRKKG